jgi:plasmid stability protein
MASITIRNLDESLKAQLRVRAAECGRSMEDEAREILRTALSRRRSSSTTNLAKAIRTRFKPLGGVELPVAPPREPMRAPPKIGGK